MRTKATELIEQANRIAGSEPENAIELYQQAIQYIEEHPDSKDDYEYLYAHYMLMFTYPKLESDYDHKTVKYAKKCLEILDPIFVNAPFTEIGKFYEEVIRSSCNAIAWHSLPYTDTDTEEELKTLLDYINRGCNYAKIDGKINPDYIHLFDTKVSVLMKMNRKDEAYNTLLKIQEANSNYEDYEGVAKSEGYKQWLNENDIVSLSSLILSDEELKRESAIDAYERIKKAELLTTDDYFREHILSRKENEIKFPALEQIQSFETEHEIHLSDSYKDFILTYGFVELGYDAYHLRSLEHYYSFAQALQEEWGHSKEQITEWFGGDYNRAQRMFIFCSGDSSFQTHYFCLMNHKGECFFFNQESGNDGPYSFDEFVAQVANIVIEEL